MQQPSEYAQNAPCAEASDGQDEHPFVRCTRDGPAGSFMIGLVLVTHGRLAVEFRAALEHVVGPQGQIESVTIGPDDDVEERRKDIIEAVRRVDTGDGVAILTDMFGGTPSNLAISVMSRPKVEVLAGINLPMLVKLAKVRDECPLAEAVAAAQGAGRKYVNIARRVLTGNRTKPPAATTNACPAQSRPATVPFPAFSSSATRRACTRAHRQSSCRPWKDLT